MKKKTMAFLLAMLMLTSTVACSEAGTGDETKTPSSNQETGDVVVDAGEETEESELTDYERRQLISDDLPDTTFNGNTFRVMTYDNSSYGNGEYEIVSEELTGDACNDSIFRRNLDIESRFDVKIECESREAPDTEMKTAVTSGITDFQLYGMFNYLAYKVINVSAAYNWNEVPHVNLDKPWHNSLANDNATINNKLFGICSDLAVSSMTYTYAIFFNMDMAETNGYPSSSLYSMVNEGTWTIDKMIEITSAMYSDLNGNGEKDTDDQFGFGYYVMNPADVWLAAFDQPICSVTDDNTIELTFMTDKTVSILEKLLDYHYNCDGFIKLPGQYDEEKYFLNNKLVMAPLRFYAAYNVLRDMEADYSMLPYPKWNEEQESYYTNADDKFTAFFIPISAVDQLDFIGTIYEALCAESYKKVYPEYYDTALKGKYSAEPETAEMVDLIMSGRNFDFSFQFGESYFDYLPYKLRNCLKDNTPDLASAYKKIEKPINKAVKNKLLPLYTD